MNLEYFDIEKYLESRNIQFWTEGRNIKKGWVNIQCIWCSDESNHLGINLDSKGLNCWICSAKGTVLKLIMKIDKCSLKAAESVVNEFSDIQTIQTSINKRSQEYEHLTQRKTTIKLPSIAENRLLSLHKKFLEKRGFEPEYIFNKYNLLCNGPIGDYRLRLIVPFYLRKKLMTFSSIDVTGKAKIKYYNYGGGLLSPKAMLYNLDSCSESVIVVEGIIDAWKIGDGACATMGIMWTISQLYFLSSFRRVFILFDTENAAQESAERLCSDLSCIVPHVERLELDIGDPGDMNESDIKHLRKEVFGKIY